MFSFFFGSPAEEKTKKQKKRARAQKKKKDAASLVLGNDENGKNEADNEDEGSDDEDEPEVLLPIRVPTERLTAESDLEASSLGDPLTHIVDAVFRKRSAAAHFTRDQAMACVMQMWDEGQAYDDAECVLQRLTANAAADQALREKESRSSGEPLEKQTETTVQAANKKDAVTVAPRNEVIVVAVPKTTAFPAIAVDDGVSTTASIPSPQAQSEALLASLPARLELAASHADKDITESLSALCSWAALVTTTAASASSSSQSNVTAPSQISREASVAAFFRSRALEMLFHQIFSRPDRLMHQLPVVQTGLSSLLRHVLRPSTMRQGGDGDKDKDGALDGLLRGLEGALTQLKDIQELKGKHQMHTTPGDGSNADNPAVMSDSTVSLLVQRVCTAVRSAYHHSITPLSSSSNNQHQQQDLSLAAAVRSPVEVLREIDGQLCEVSTAMAQSQQPVGGSGGSGELQRSLVMREMASDKLTLLLQSLEQITQCVTTGAATGTNAVSLAPSHRPQALALDPLGAALLAGTPLDVSPSVASACASTNGSPMRGGGNDNGSVNTAVSVSVDALLGQQMQSLQAESRARVAPLLVELETATAQAANLHARKQALLLELHGVETDLNAAMARSHALQSSVEEHQRVFDLKLQTLIALVPPPTPPLAPALAGASSKTTVTLQLQKHVTDLLGHLHAMEHPAAQTISANLQQQSPQLARQVPGRVTASEAALAEYVDYEGRCLSMLADRLLAGRTELAKLQAEHKAYQGLNMKGMLSGTAARISQASMEVADDERAVFAMQDALVDTLSRFQLAVTTAAATASSSVTPSLSRLDLPRPQLECAVAALDKAFATTEAGHHQLPPLLQPYRVSSTVPTSPPPGAEPSTSSSSSSPNLSSATSSPTAQKPTMSQQQQSATKTQQPPKQPQKHQQQPPPRPPVSSSFDENLYTKKLDISQFTPEQIEAAERLAREIEDQAAATLTSSFKLSTAPVNDGAMPAAVTTPSSSSKPRSKGGQNSASKISQSNPTAQSTTQSASHDRPPPSSHSTTTTAPATASGTPTTSVISVSATLAKPSGQSQDSQGARASSNRGRGNGQGRPGAGPSQSNPIASSQTSQSKANGRPVNEHNTGNNAVDSINSADSKTPATSTSSLTTRPVKTNGRDRDKSKAVDKDVEAAVAKFHVGKPPAIAATATTNASVTKK